MRVCPELLSRNLMGKTKRAAAITIGAGNVTPRQIAFLVDCYLSNAGFSNTRSLFRTEASSLLSDSPVQEAFRNLMSLETIVNEYVLLKETKASIEQEKTRLDLERTRVNNLLSGIHEVMNAYNSSSSPLPLHPPAIASSSPDCPRASPGIPPLSTPSTGNVCPDVKRRKISSAQNDKVRSVNQTSTVAKNLFHQPWLSSSATVTIPATTSFPNTPPQITPTETISTVSLSATAPLAVTPTCCTVITTERVVMSPCKKMTYYSRDQCIASSSPEKTTLTRISKRDCVKSRLNFDGSDAATTPSESEKEGDIFDIDLDLFGPDFSFADLLGDLDIDNASGSSASENMSSEFPHSVLSEQNSLPEGGTHVTAMSTITQCIAIHSPAKKEDNE